MRKQTKLVAVLSAAALMAIGASATAFAATAGWSQEDGEWVYLDRNGDRVTDEWRRSNGYWYYLDEDGYMARDQVIEDDDDKYYVDSNGVRVTNAWVSMDNDDLLDDDDQSESIDTVWMYFDGSGKALGCDTTNGEIKKLTYGDGSATGYFIFNEDGYMLSGWQRWSKSGNSEKLYYLGGQNEGWARTGWQYLTIDPDIDAFSGINQDDDNYNDEEWFYFKSDGKAVEDDDRTINGRTYIFDEFGRMLDLWVYASDSSSAYTNEGGSSTATNSAYYNEDNGDRGQNWIYAYPQTDYDDYSDDPYWFYLDSNGKPFRAVEGSSKLTAVGSAYRVDDDNVVDESDPEYNGEVGARSIKSETYLFNSKGVMLTGLYWLGGEDEGGTDAPVYKGTSSEPLDAGYYFFSTDDGSAEGQMVTNKKVTIDIDGEDEVYYFKKSGAAYTDTIISGTVYGHDGKRMDDFGDGSTYQIVTLEYDLYEKGDTEPAVTAGSQVLLNENGKIKKSGTTTDINDQKVRVNNYVVVSVEDDD
ncbi:MAG TPA: hypothetical protein IAA51_04295 [Candidatus Cottocaccamicrobium excrementipullorum]|nr:hypothetical protein [Candidatus Cottocaccamicrobium excrementipullorum]